MSEFCEGPAGQVSITVTEFFINHASFYCVALRAYCVGAAVFFDGEAMQCCADGPTQLSSCSAVVVGSGQAHQHGWAGQKSPPGLAGWNVLEGRALRLRLIG
jgi:hypothetical protein